MIKVMQLTYYLLSLIGIATMMGHSQETASQYVSPSQTVPKGRAPRMQVQLLSRGEQTKDYAVIFGKGDEALSGLLEFAENYHITSAHFTAIGALNGATLAWFDPQRKMYKKIPIQGQVEVILPGKARGSYAHDCGDFRRNNARRPCSGGVCIPDAGSNGHSRSDSDAEAV